jgi:hypothetical protein
LTTKLNPFKKAFPKVVPAFTLREELSVTGLLKVELELTVRPVRLVVPVTVRVEENVPEVNAPVLGAVAPVVPL